MKYGSITLPLILIAATNVLELNVVEHTENGLRFGASVTLTIMEEFLKRAIEKYEGDNFFLPLYTAFV